jgi:AraC-like DNA-binding protein/mannose-6-phosphate isomerase-like protein (cupin superfamily)
MAKKKKTTSGNSRSRKDRPEYLSPDAHISDYADYSADILMPVFSIHTASGKGYIEDKSHKHNEFELLYVLNGSVTVFTDKTSLHISSNKGLFIKRGVTHSIEPDPDTDVELEIIHFHHSLLFGSVAGTLAGKYLLGILDNEEYDCISLNSEKANTELIIQKMHEIYEYMQSGQFGNDLHIIANLYDIWALGIASYRSLPVVSLSRQQIQDKKRISKATAYISEHYMEDILLSDIAEVCDVCNSECCRTFRRALHMSPMDYVNRYRVYTAAELLTQDRSNTPMSEIALQVGFNYASYFNKTFKRYLGMTPLQYRSIHNKKLHTPEPSGKLRI